MSNSRRTSTISLSCPGCASPFERLFARFHLNYPEAADHFLRFGNGPSVTSISAFEVTRALIVAAGQTVERSSTPPYAVARCISSCFQCLEVGTSRFRVFVVFWKHDHHETHGFSLRVERTPYQAATFIYELVPRRCLNVASARCAVRLHLRAERGDGNRHAITDFSRSISPGKHFLRAGCPPSPYSRTSPPEFDKSSRFI